jgi:hypothetical protein
VVRPASVIGNCDPNLELAHLLQVGWIRVHAFLTVSTSHLSPRGSAISAQSFRGWET